MGLQLQFMVETITHEHPQWIANMDAPQDNTFHSLLGGTPSKENKNLKPTITPKGLPSHYSKEVSHEIRSREGSDATGKNIVVSYLTPNELSAVYQEWREIKGKTSRLISIEIIMSIFHQFAIRDWGRARMIYCLFE